MRLGETSLGLPIQFSSYALPKRPSTTGTPVIPPRSPHPKACAMGQNIRRATASDNRSVSTASLDDVLADPTHRTSQQTAGSHPIPHRPASPPTSSVTTAMATSPTQYISALSLASSPSPSSHRAPPQSQSSDKPTPSYRSLLKSHRRLESTIAALQSQLNEEKRSAAWWKNRVCELDARCRSIDVDLARVTKEKHILDRAVAKFQMRERLVPRMIEAAAQTDEDEEGGENATERREGENRKDLVIKALVQMVWNKRAESMPLSTSVPAGCECDAAEVLRNLFSEPPNASVAAAGPSARALEEETEDEGAGDDPLKRMLRTRGGLGKARTTGALDGRDSGRAPFVESPPHPHPEAASKARQEKKEALKMRLWAARERVDGLRKENGVLEELLREGSEADRNPIAEGYGDEFGHD